MTDTDLTPAELHAAALAFAYADGDIALATHLRDMHPDEFVAEMHSLLDEDEDEPATFAAPGPPPRPGLEWKDATHRWVNPHSGEEHHPDGTATGYHDAHTRIEKHPELNKLKNAGKFFGLINPLRGTTANAWTKGEDKVGTQLAKAVGHANKPKVVSAAEMDNLKEQGWTIGYRAVQQEAHHNGYRKGELWTGTGLHGSGTYVAYVQPGGKFPDEAAAHKGTRSYGQHVTRFALAPDAKVVEEDDLEAERKKDMAHLAEMHRSGKLTSKQYDNLKTILKDNGRYATLKGYDAITKASKGYMVILNRSKTAVQENNL